VGIVHWNACFPTVLEYLFADEVECLRLASGSLKNQAYLHRGGRGSPIQSAEGLGRRSRILRRNEPEDLLILAYLLLYTTGRGRATDASLNVRPRFIPLSGPNTRG